MSAPPRLGSVPDAVAALRRGDRRLLARLLSLLEDGAPAGSEAMAAIRETGAAQPSVLALTGPPGVGKSTLVAALAKAATGAGRRVAILAVDPSSPRTGGAVLGDRVRMANEVSEDVFIRSFANRGVVGGLARVVPDAVDLVAACGYELVLVETVGVGQSELEVARFADVTCVVLAPYLGDEIQAVKAGLMEIADVFVVNKSDLPGASQAVRDIRSATRLRHVDHRDVQVLKVAATTGAGIDEAWAALASLLEVANGRGSYAERAGAARLDELAAAAAAGVRAAGAVEDSLVARAVRGELSLAEAVARIETALRDDA